MPISSSFFISEDSLVDPYGPRNNHHHHLNFNGRYHNLQNDRREYFRHGFPSPAAWSMGVRPGRPSTTRTRSTKKSIENRNARQSDEESLTEHHLSSIIKYPLPGPLSPHHEEARKLWIKMFVVFAVLLFATIMGTMSIYWGADYSLQFNIPVLTIAVVDFDHGEVGRYIQGMADAARAEDYDNSLGFVNLDGDEKFGSGGVDAVHRALHNQEFWFAVIVHENATTAMNNAYTIGDPDYDPKGAVEIIYEEARCALVIGEVVYPRLMTFMDEFVMGFTRLKQMSMTVANAGDLDALQRQVDNPISVGFTVTNKVPAVPSTAEAATEIGTIYLIIVSFLSVLMFDKLSDTIMGNIPTRTYYIYRIAVLPFVYFFLSLFYLCLSCAWHIPFSRFFGSAGYVIYWMLSWISMMAFGLTIENINNILGMPFTPVFFLFWVISNVTTGFYPTEMLRDFYKWGIVWPLRQDMMGSRAIIYGTKNTLRENFGVLLGWVVIGLLLQPGTIWVQLRRKKTVLEAKRREVLVRVWGEPGREKGGALRLPTLK